MTPETLRAVPPRGAGYFAHESAFLDPEVVIGGGTVVTKDVPDYALVLGNPGRVTGWMCACGSRIQFEGADDKGTCRACGRRYRKAQSKVWPEYRCECSTP